MKIAMLAPIAWATPPAAYGPWEQVTSHLTEGLVSRGLDVTLFATGTSRTAGKLVATVAEGYAETPGQDAKILEYHHIGRVMDRAGEFDIVHNQFDFMPLSFSPHLPAKMVTTIHGFSSERILPIYQRYDPYCAYVSISDADRNAGLSYAATVYNGIDVDQFSIVEKPGNYLLYFGRIHPDKGAAEAIDIARAANKTLLMAGLVQDENYWRERVEPYVDGERVRYLGNVGPAERDRLLGGALGLLHPISFDEPFGLSVAESLLCGTPVVAYRRGSMPELIDHGVTGWLCHDVPSALASLAFLGTCDRAQIARTARERFSVEKMVDGYVRVYERLLAGE